MSLLPPINYPSSYHAFYPTLQNQNQRWSTTWGGHVIIREKSRCGIRNLIGFVLAIKNVNRHLNRSEQINFTVKEGLERIRK